MPNRESRVTSCSRLNMENFGNKNCVMRINRHIIPFFPSKVSSVWFFIFVFKANTAASLNSTFLGIFKPTLQSSLCYWKPSGLRIFFVRIDLHCYRILAKNPLNQPKSFKCQFVVSWKWKQKLCFFLVIMFS